MFVADPSESHVRVYAHGATKPTRTLNDSGYNPLSCAVDPKSGNLAVTSYLGSNNHGDLAIYTHAIGAPKVYNDANIPHMSYASYDGAGNLFLDGVTSSHKVVVAELAKGGTHLQAIALNQTIANAGGVGWDGTYLDVGDVAASVIYRFKISAGKGTKVGSTPLNGSAYVDEFSIQGTQVIVPDFGERQGPLLQIPRRRIARENDRGIHVPAGNDRQQLGVRAPARQDRCTDARYTGPLGSSAGLDSYYPLTREGLQ